MKPPCLFLLCLLVLPLFGQSSVCNPKQSLQQANEHIAVGAFKPAREAAMAGLQCAWGKEALDLLLTRYQAHRNRRRFKRALKAAQMAADSLTILPLPQYKLSVALALAESATFANDPEAKAYLAEAHRIAQTLSLTPYEQGRLTFIEGLQRIRIDQEVEPAIALYRKALQLLERQEQPATWLKGQVMRILGNHARNAADYKQSAQYYEQELTVYLGVYPADQEDVAICHYNLGGVLYEALEYQRALDHFLACFDVWKEKYPPSSRYYRFLTEAIADMYWEIGNRVKALEFYDKATAEEKKVNRDSSIAKTAIADSLLQSGRALQALPFYQQALAFRKRNFGARHPMTAACQNFVARGLEASGQIDTALRAYQATIQMLVEGFENTDPLSNPSATSDVSSIQHLLEALSGKGVLLLAKAQSQEDPEILLTAYKTLQLALHYLEVFRQSPMREASKLFWNQRSKILLANAMEAAVALYQLEGDRQYLQEAFQLAEQSKAFLLLSALQDEEATKYAGVPADVMEKERRLRQQIRTYENKVTGEEQRCAEAREKQLVLWREKLVQLRNDYDILIQYLQSDYPSYFEWKYQLPEVEISQLQQELSQRAIALLSYFESDDQLYLFYLDAIRFELFEVPLGPPVKEITQAFANHLQHRDSFLRSPSDAYQKFTQGAYQLYQTFIEPAFIGQEKSAKRLLVLPSQRLSTIPFGLLLQKPADLSKRNYAALDYLLRDYSVFYAPSAAVWMQANRTSSTKRAKVRYAGFAPEYKDVEYPELGMIPELMYNRQEVEEAHQIWGGKTYFNRAATEQALVSTKATILHIAAHGYLNEPAPLLSKLMLFPKDSTSDGVLHSYEIYGMQLPTQLTILSACHSAAGTFEQGEGMMSLERAFQYAGCPALLSSFWAADDAVATQLTVLFLEELKSGLSKDMALQKAQLRFLEHAPPDQQIPYYWAGFRLSGNIQPIQTSNNIWWLAGVMALGIGLALWGWRTKKGKGSVQQ